MEFYSSVLLGWLGREHHFLGLLLVIHSSGAFTRLSLVKLGHQLVLLLSLRWLAVGGVGRQQGSEVATACHLSHFMLLAGVGCCINILDDIIDFLLCNR